MRALDKYKVKLSAQPTTLIHTTKHIHTVLKTNTKQSCKQQQQDKGTHHHSLAIQLYVVQPKERPTKR